MTPFFEQKYRYIAFESIDNVRSELKSILNTPWYDITINIAGKLSNDNKFKLYPKFTLGIQVFGVIQGFSILKGRLEPAEGQTNIIIEVRPTYGVLFAFYLVLLIIIFKLVGLFALGTETEWVLLIVLFFVLVFLRSLIHFSMTRLKDRFERIMSLHPED